MKPDLIVPLWRVFWRQAWRLRSECSLDELRRLELAAWHWHANVADALHKREARFGRRPASAGDSGRAAA